MGKDNTQEFLQVYKSLEQTVLSVFGITIREYEDQDLENGKKLQICRLIRNYASHNIDTNTFLPVPPETIQFLKNMEQKVIASKGEAKEYLKKVTPIKATDTKPAGFKRYCAVYTKYGISEAPVVDEHGMMVGLVTLNHLIQYTAGKDTGADLVACLGLAKNYTVVPLKCPMVTAAEMLKNIPFLVITADGTKKREIHRIVDQGGMPLDIKEKKWKLTDFRIKL